MQPFPCIRGVKQVQFSVYNRWGKLVHSQDNDININWNGVTTEGEKISDGVYFYHATIIYHRRLKKPDTKKELKGWVHVIRKEEDIAPK